MKIFMVCLSAWFVAQVIKVIINFTKYVIDKKKGRKAKKVTLETLFKLGGMPSSHTATVVSLCTCVAIQEGIDSLTFAVAGVFAFITMFDAFKVRLPISRLTDAFNRIQAKVCNNEAKDVKKVEGHTIPEIIGGIVVGVSVALFMHKVVNIFEIEMAFIDTLNQLIR